MDTLTGGDGRDALFGEANSDDLTGGGGRDALHGGAGLDQLRDGDPPGGSIPPDADLLDGGPDSDTASCATRTKPLSVDLGAAGPVNDERGEGDTLTDIENVTGGKGPDRLAGNDADNWIDGGGRDSVIATRSRLGCLDPDCEELQLAWPTDALTNGSIPASAYPAKSGRRWVGFPFGSCPGMEDEFAPCTARVRLRATFGAHRLLARGTVPRRRYATPALVRVQLTDVGRRPARRRHGVRATVEFRMQAFGHWAGVLRARWDIRLKVPVAARTAA